MNAVAALYQTTIGKKVIMALTGLILVGWVTAHMLGNALVFAGPEWFDWHTDMFHRMGIVHWLMRGGMLAVLVAHIWSAIALARLSNAARPEAYQHARERKSATLASITMRIGGLYVLVFLIWHLAELTAGVAHADYKVHESFHNVSVTLGNPILAGVYALAAIAVGMHISHGVQSLFQSLGFNHPKWNSTRKGISLFVGLFIGAGNLAIALSIITGLAG